MVRRSRAAGLSVGRRSAPWRIALSNAVESAETYVTELIQERRHRPFDVAMRALMFCLSRLFRSLVQARIRLYGQRIFRPKSLGCLVVSIGNLTVGGTGKTPVVEVFARALSHKGRTVAILSRGYRSRDLPLRDKLKMVFRRLEPPPPRVVTDGTQMLLDPETSGDEPYMLGLNLENVAILVDRDRVKSGRYAIQEFHADTLILDDGFQYLPLKPKLNILLVDSTHPFGNHHLLPRGVLREPIANLRRADFIFLTKSNGGKHLRHLRGFLRQHNPRAEIIECTHRPKHLENVYSQERLPLADLQGRRVAAICGIAAPESFEGFLRSLGAELVHRERYADHHWFSARELSDFYREARQAGAEWVLTTQKDAVRFPNVGEPPLPVLFLRVEIDILSGHESFEECISRICISQLQNTTLAAAFSEA